MFKYTTLACICQVFFQIFWLNKFDLFIIAILLYSNLVQIFVFLNIDSPTTCGRALCYSKLLNLDRILNSELKLFIILSVNWHNPIIS